MNILRNAYLKFRYILLYGLLSAILIFLLKWLQWKFLIVDNSLDIYLGLLALLFTAFGVWLASQLSKPKIHTVVVEREVPALPGDARRIDEAGLKKLNLTGREYEVLQLMAKGKSNAEIAEGLFLSVSTVKTHASNLFLKMEVKSRTQAIEKARRLRLVS